MKYMLFICVDPAGVADPGADDDIERWLDETGERRLDGERLHEPKDAKTVVVRNGKVVVTDGPFTESKEWIAGFDIIDVSGVDEAIEIASRHPMANGGRVEVREFWPFEG